MIRISGVDAMLERVQSEGVAPKVTMASSANRADLAVSPAPRTAELRDRAVAPVGSAYRSSTEPNPLASSALAVGQIRGEFDKMAKAESDRKALDTILGKLLPGYKALLDKIDAPAAVEDAQAAITALHVLHSSLAGSPAASSPQDRSSVSANTPDQAIALIEGALRVADHLRARISDDLAGAHDRLLNLGTPAVGSVPASSQAVDHADVTKATAAARDLILSNGRSFGVAHGRLSPDMARLVLG